MGEIILTDLTVGSVVAVFVLGQSLKYIAAVRESVHKLPFTSIRYRC